MPLIDESGRFFGKVNLIDAFIGLGVLGLIPVVYVAFLLFRAPSPTVTSVEPAQVVEHQPATVRIHGANLRPYLDARVGGLDAPSYLIQTPELAVIQLPDLGPGTYDVSLHDEGQDLVRVPNLLTVVPTAPPRVPTTAAPRIAVQTIGVFESLSEEEAQAIQQGSTFHQTDETTTPASRASVAEVLAIRPAQPGTRRIQIGASAVLRVPMPGELQVPAIIRVHCALDADSCKIGDITVAENAVILLPLHHWFGSQTNTSEPYTVRFRIGQVRPADAPVEFPSVRTAVATIRVRFTAPEELADLMKVGDVGESGVAEDGPAVLIEVGADRQAVSAETVTAALTRSYVFQLSVVAFTGTVRVPVVFDSSGWSYNLQSIKVGAPFTFETVSGAMGGLIVDVQLDRETERIVE